MKTTLILLAMTSLVFVANAAQQIPEYKLIERDVHKSKGQVYLRVELKAPPQTRDSAPIETLCKSLDTDGARKFVVFVHLPGEGARSAYAFCGRLPKSDGLEVRML
ncbi:hypothetical protein [Bordetella genomosp. 9]|uniref:hypothetical protein n=1 Tax=Bordetella genomosp. 9 TaxID=1416803 RepID=UPI0012F877A7|nr:hypothetical protein [Bordetella genomosp. 9]